jgi:hypothetical protein
VKEDLEDISWLSGLDEKEAELEKKKKSGEITACNIDDEECLSCGS